MEQRISEQQAQDHTIRYPLVDHIIAHIERRCKVMSKRRSMSRGKDKKVYTQTAEKTKKINIKPKLARGGIRL